MVHTLALLPVAVPASSAVYGGASKADQGRDLRSYKPHILVATPGRLQDLFDDMEVDLSQVRGRSGPCQEHIPMLMLHMLV